MEKNWGGKSPQLCICMTSVILKGYWSVKSVLTDSPFSKEKNNLLCVNI